MLDRFRAAKAAEIDHLRRLAERDALPRPWEGKRPSFSQALLPGRRPALIAEYKRASPSRGDINLDLSPEETARAYAKAGAAALSVLTEETWFKGSLGFLDRMTGPGLPLLRKDFLFDPLQVTQTAATPASALLLIVRMTQGAADLGRLLAAATAAGLEAVTEVFSLADLEIAREAGATIIQVNNRDLDTLAVDLGVSRALAREKRQGEIWISASGIALPTDLVLVRDLGFDAALIGTGLMAGGDPAAALSGLRGEDLP